MFIKQNNFFQITGGGGGGSMVIFLHFKESLAIC